VNKNDQIKTLIRRIKNSRKIKRGERAFQKERGSERREYLSEQSVDSYCVNMRNGQP
jgi:hypothetical protein